MENKATAMVFTGSGEQFAEKTVTLGPITSEEVLVQIVYTTICTSDLHTYTGRRVSPMPSVLGHEIIGRIVSKGESVSVDNNGEALQIGDLVTWCVYAYDDTSVMALKGIPQKSEGLYKYGHHEFSENDALNGGFATHCLLRKGTAIYKLPAGLSFKEAAPLNCTYATMAGALRVAGDLTNKNILVTGTGMLGVSACAMAKESGAKNIYAMDINEARLEFSKQFGVTKTFKGELTAAEVNKVLLPEEKIDVVIDTTGIPAVIEKGLSLLVIGGIAVWIGAVYSQPATQVNAEMVVRNLLTIKGLHNYIPSDLGFAVTFMANNHTKYPFHLLVGDEFTLQDLSPAFDAANTGKHYRVGIKQ